uniref:Transmembrane BAX inhibitor motif containing 1a n=1 Tax=Sinocyclocheilus rhinocerous TaxID=307959 RepID=A0A673K5Z7_9TELE
MSRSDFPPGYDDSRLLSNPQPGGGYPASVPPYGFNAYGGQPPYPQPNDPYGGQPAGYPPPSIPVIPVIPPGLGDNEGFTTTGGFDDISVRHTFIRKVYLILGAQLLVTATIVAIFTFVEPVGVFVRKNPAIYWVSYAVYFVTHLVLVCCQGPSYYSTKAVFLALGITVLVSVAVTVFCFQTKVDFTKCSGFFCVLGIVVFVTGIITAIVLSFKYIPWLHMLYAAIGAIAFTLFLAYHTQLLIGNRKLSIGPEEYVFAALSLYVDIVQIFIFLLQIIGYAER